MVCNNYLPRFQDQINSYDPLGGLNCTCYSGAMAADYHTCGSKRPTGEKVRYYTGDRSGGTTLPQVDYALNRGWGVDLDTRIGSSKLTWTQFVVQINAGRGAILQGSYDVIRPTRFTGSPTFYGNHAIFIPPGWGAMDPLCDGRRPGVYKYHGERYPQELLKRFAGRLVVDPRNGHRLGYGYAYCSLTKDNRVNIYRRVRVPAGVFLKYWVVDGVIQTYRRYETEDGFIGACTAPRNYPARPGLPFKSRSLVKITSGSREGAYVSSKYYHEG